jgi:hypothetical protein
MKKTILIIIIFNSFLLFSQNDYKNEEISFVLKNSEILFLQSENDGVYGGPFSDYYSYFHSIGFDYKYFTKYERLNISFLYLFHYYLKANNNNYYYSTQFDIPIGYSLYFFKKTWFNPSIGFSINNNFIINERIKYYTNTTKINFRYQIAFALNAGLSFTIKKRYTLNLGGFINIFSNYKLNPKGERTTPYKMYGYNFGVGYKF